MADAVLVISAVIGVLVVALSGIRFTRSEDARYDAVVESEAPALWGVSSTDEILSR